MNAVGHKGGTASGDSGNYFRAAEHGIPPETNPCDMPGYPYAFVRCQLICHRLIASVCEDKNTTNFILKVCVLYQIRLQNRNFNRFYCLCQG